MFIWDFVSWFFGFFVTFSCLILFFVVFVDVFRDETLEGWAKALWVLFLVFVPFLSTVVYLIVRRKSMAMRQGRGEEVVHDDFDFVRP
ncbi:PLDc N-terminal domain-containing protein [Leifsonia sp. YIM 134122]|uniref:PLDc N-terminal domain-containing protein n=1 Tax=Leifsonia stereocauli TaxID=3134136 RepID=A0ABU9W1R1_9MICO